MTVLALQSVGLLVQKASATASIHLKITHPDKQHIQMAQSVTSGDILGITEDYTL
jgi:hypothetical protein